MSRISHHFSLEKTKKAMNSIENTLKTLDVKKSTLLVHLKHFRAVVMFNQEYFPDKRPGHIKYPY